MNQNGKNWVIESLNSNHNRSSFQCGVESLDNYIKKQAKQDIKRKISQVFVAAEINHPDKIVGYYTLSSLSIELNKLPTSLSKKLPKHPIPAALVRRLAVSQKKQGLGLGSMLLIDAIKRTLSVSKNIAIYALIVDAIDDQIIPFYKKFGFIQFNSEASRLFLPLKSV